MYTKIIQTYDKPHFGTKTTIYRGEENFFIIIDGRDGKNYFFADLDLVNFYPVNSYMRSINYEYGSENDGIELNLKFDINLSKYGYSPSPKWLRNLFEAIKEIS